MLKINDSQVIYALAPNNKAVETIEPGMRVEFATKDCFSNEIQSEKDLFESVGWATINPATGPVYVQGAEPGDTLVVYIEGIEVADQGCMVTVPDMGAAGNLISKTETKIIPIKNQQAIFNDKISIPIDPMIGVIGTAPANDEIPCGTPGAHGGNMDTRLIKKGNTLYLPVNVTGALLAMGDLHAVMGDGEVSVTGVEISGKVTVKIDLIKGNREDWPVLETQDSWYVIASGEDLDEAADLALKAMLKFLEKRTDLSINDRVSLLSAIGNLEISQIVDPLKTVRMGISKEIMKNYQLTF